MGSVAFCSPEQAVADALDCLCVPTATYMGSVEVVYFNGHSETLFIEHFGDCENSPCGPADHFNNCDDDYDIE